MKKELIKKEYDSKIDLVKKYNKAYFDEDKPLVSDREYDLLKTSILDLEKKYFFLKDKYSPSTNVGYKPSNKFQKINHEKPMLSLSNAFNKNDMKDFLNKISNFLNNKDSLLLEA